MKIIKYLLIVYFLLVPVLTMAQDSGVQPAKAEYYRAQVIKAEDLDKKLDINTEFLDYQLVTVKILEGPKKGHDYQFENTASLYNKNDQRINEGEKIIVSFQVVNGEEKLGLVDFDRTWPLIFLVVLFVAILVAIGYWIGVKSLLGFIWIGAILVWLMIPGILAGNNIYWTVFITAMLVIIGSTLLLIGPQKKALLVIGSSLFGLAISAGLILLVGSWARFSEIGLEESHLFHISDKLSGLDLVGIFYAGMIIGSLGSMMDISISIIAGVDELLKMNQTKGTRKIDSHELFRSGMNIGRDIMAVNANTLLLAYAGSAITVWMVAVSQGYEWSLLINFNQVFVEVLRILSGTIGIFASIPMTAFLASRLLVYKRKMAYEEMNNE
ncbi:MAG: YibE/F family protein [Patescibacteria group bacterium]